MRKAIAVCGVILLGLGTFLLLSELSIFPLGTRNQIAIAEHPNTYGTLGFFLESGQNCLVEIADAGIEYESAFIRITQVQEGYTILKKVGSACSGTYTMEFRAPVMGDYSIRWDNLYLRQITVYRIDEMVPVYALLVADVLVLVVGVIILSIGISKS